MPDDQTSRRPADAPRHGARRLSAVEVDAYNEELRHAEGGFLGDRASSRAFTEILDDWRDRLRRGVGEDPLGGGPTEEFRRKDLDAALAKGDPEAAGLVQCAVEDFAREFAAVIRRFLRLKAWQKTERIVVGGGFRESRIGELAIGRAAVMLKANGIETDLVPIRHHPDEAGLIGAVHLLPSAALKGRDVVLAVDIGGSNIRVGLVEPRLAKAPDLSAARVHRSERWRHRDESPTREQAVAKLVGMLKGLAALAAKEKLRIAPWIGIGCPGLIEEDGRISNGAQNLPGNWQTGGFNLAERLEAALPELDGAPTRAVMHNDAVVQGLSEAPFQQDLTGWGVVTIGTGLGNAHFTNRGRRGGGRAEP